MRENRKNNETRPIKITRNYIMYPQGSVLIEMGNTKVICNVTVEPGVPKFKKGSGEGWLTAEYSMLPGATNTRNNRDIKSLKLNGRTMEIQRLIGRAIRAVVDLKKIGENTILIDCDVIQADGGTRTASISGAFVAVYDAVQNMMETGQITENPITKFVSAVSVGIVKGEALLDLCYEEDSNADVDMNIIMTDDGKFVEIQGTGEGNTFDDEELKEMLEYGKIGNRLIQEEQKKSLNLL